MLLRASLLGRGGLSGGCILFLVGVVGWGYLKSSCCVDSFSVMLHPGLGLVGIVGQEGEEE